MNLIVKAAIRIIVFLGAVKLLETITSTTLIYVVQAHASGSQVAELAIVAAGSGLVLYAFWAKSAAIARTLIGHVDVNTLAINTSSTDVFKVAVHILGIVLFVTSLPPLFGLISYRIAASHHATIPLASSPDEIREWVQTITSILIGALMAFGAKQTVSIISRGARWAETGGSSDPNAS